MALRCAILDDYQRVALKMADWSPVARDLDVTVFDRNLEGEDAVATALADFDAVVLMRERTPFPARLLARLPRLKFLITTGRRNPSVDLDGVEASGVVACGTSSLHHPTAELTWGLILALCRHIPQEDCNLRRGGPWQLTVGTDLKGRTLGIVGLGHLGIQVARIGLAFGMEVAAWSHNLTPERCAAVGARYLPKDELVARSDVLTIHTNLSRRTVDLIAATELARMKRSAILVNTSRGPIVNEAALIAALRDGTIAGAALDTYDIEPLPPDHPLRTLPNTVLTPHLGYVTEDNYRLFFSLVVEGIRAWLDGAPVRRLAREEQLDRSL